jgi:hypothetical protein
MAPTLVRGEPTALLFAVFQGQTCLLHAGDYAHRSTLIVIVAGLDRHPGDSCVLWARLVAGTCRLRMCSVTNVLKRTFVLGVFWQRV